MLKRWEDRLRSDPRRREEQKTATRTEQPLIQHAGCILGVWRGGKTASRVCCSLSEWSFFNGHGVKPRCSHSIQPLCRLVLISRIQWIITSIRFCYNYTHRYDYAFFAVVQRHCRRGNGTGGSQSSALPLDFLPFHLRYMQHFDDI